MRILVVLLLATLVVAKQKREADPGLLYGHHNLYGTVPPSSGFYRPSYVQSYNPGIAHHPYGGISYVQSQHHSVHKREAEPEPGRTYTYGYPYGYAYGYTYGYPSGYSSSYPSYTYGHYNQPSYGYYSGGYYPGNSGGYYPGTTYPYYYGYY
ncbi:hypothetical protein SK128_015852 [Halocaridina rubra]|uniref:Prisilkin-39-like n=1 Tax=Halocaridina rubra TaxID=373956 RepID=A0AAN8XCB6_HALRR